MKKLGLYSKVKSQVWSKEWSINSKSVGYGEKAFVYMADYLFQVGISNQRILKCEGSQVTLPYKDSHSKVSLSDGKPNQQRPCCPRCKQPMILTDVIEKRNRSPLS